MGLCTVQLMTVMAVRCIIKYRHNMYQTVRTNFRFCFFSMGLCLSYSGNNGGRPPVPYTISRNAFPLDYEFLFQGI